MKKYIDRMYGHLFRDTIRDHAIDHAYGKQRKLLREVAERNIRLTEALESISRLYGKTNHDSYEDVAESFYWAIHIASEGLDQSDDHTLQVGRGDE